ncbi:MAG: SNF2 helicase associated domain-containing protein [Verrucomicrobia bacterium]|nr:SNF2 helicase associated domain-containing protein [Verrucomicrobiota bacterium]
MLNFRRIKQEFSPAILRQGKDLHIGKGVLQAKVIEVDAQILRVIAKVQGSYENVHECEVEIARVESELIDSNCDCSYEFDCQHLGALLHYLEEKIDRLLSEFSGDLDATVQGEIEEAQKKEEARQDQQRQEEVLSEYRVGSVILGKCPFFLPPAKQKFDEAELAFLLPEELNVSTQPSALVPLHLALRLPSRSKPLHIADTQAFLEGIRYSAPVVMSNRLYCFALTSFSPVGQFLLQVLLDGGRFVEGEEKIVLLPREALGQLLAKLSDQFNDQEQIPGCFLGSLEHPLRLCPKRAVLQVKIEHLRVPAPKIFLSPSIVVQEEALHRDKVCLLRCVEPGLIHSSTYYRFQGRVRRIHLDALSTVEELTVPEPLFGTFIENALPRLHAIADVVGEEVLESYATLPFAGPLRACCKIEYLDGELSARLFFLYEGTQIPATADQLSYEQARSFVTKEGIVARNLVEEQQLIGQLFQGFIFDENEKAYVAKTERRVVEFMTEMLPRFSDQVDFECPQNLMDQFLYDDTHFELHFSEGERIDVYQVTLKVRGYLQGVKIDRLWECLAAKRTYLELAKGKILVLNLDRLFPMVQFFDEIGIHALEDSTQERPLWSLASLHANQFDHLPVTISLSAGLQEIQQQMLGLRAIEPTDLPTEIVAELRPYQKEGVHWLERLRMMRLGGILADDMGLGKTLQAIIAITQYHLCYPEQQTLIVCPTSLLYNWKEEFYKFNPRLSVHVIDGTPSQRQRQLSYSGEIDILITSYSLLQKDIDAYMERMFGYVVLDEAQHIKNRGTRNARSVKQVRAAHRLVLTGTPVENALDELWSLFDFLMPGLLSTYERFVEKYIRSSAAGNTSALDVLSKKVSPFILRRMKQDVLDDLPPVDHITYRCHLSEIQKELYRSYAHSAREELSRLVKSQGFDKVQIHVLATLTRLKQICCHPAIFAKEVAEPGDSAKYDMLLDLLPALIEGGHKTVIFSQYTGMLKIMRKDFEALGVRFVYLDGSSKNRLELVKQFNEDDRISVFLVSLKAGGTGLNLIGADTVIHYDMWWNPAVENQATDRVHRIGQKRSVSSYKLITMGTIEEKICDMQKRKEGLVKRVVSCDDEAVAKLTWEEVLELLQV